MTQELTSRAQGSLRALADVPGPRGLPVLGNLLEIDTARIHLALEAFYRQYGPMFSFRLGPERCLGVGDPDLVRTLLRERPHDFRRIKTMESTARELGMHGVFSAEGEDWRRQRRLMMPAFRDENLARHFDVMRTITERLVKLLGPAAVSGAPFDILHHLMRYTVDVTAEVAFGRDMNTLERGADELQRHFETIFPMLLRRVLAPVPYWRWVKLPADHALDRAVAASRDALLPLIDRARAELDADPARRAAPRTLLEAMLVASSEADGGGRLTNAEVLANVLTLLLAGEDTTANTMAWIVYHLGKHPDVQRELRVEIDAELGAETTFTSHTAALRMRYLGAVVHETMRLKSPAPFIALSAARDVEIADVAVPAGTPVFALMRMVATRADTIPDPDRFEPRRWLAPDDAAAMRTQLARASMPFGAGPRVCPGRQLALLECALVIAALVKQFEISLPEGLDVKERFDFAMEPENLRVIVRPLGPRV
jgi:cytochrome P450